MPSIRIPLIGSEINRLDNPISFLAKDQHFINCYPEVTKNPITGKGRAMLNKRYGGADITITSGYRPARAATVWSGNSAATSPLVFSFTNGTTAVGFFDGIAGTQIGADIAISSAAKCVEMGETSISGVANLVAFVGDTTLIEAWYFPEGGSWTQITDGDFPSNQSPALVPVGQPVFMDGYMFVMCSNGQIWNSDVNSLANWTATSFISSQSYPDNGVNLARYKNTIVAFNKGSIEFFQNAGNAAGSPLSPIPNAVLKLGGSTGAAGSATTRVRTVLTAGGTVYFIGIDLESGKTGIYRLNGYQADKVSTPAIDKLIAFGSTGAAFAGSCMLHGMTHVIMYSATPTVPCYCIDTNTWWEFNFTNGGSNTAIEAILGNPAANYFTVDATGLNHIYTMLAGTYQDKGGTAYSATIQLESMDMGTSKRKFWNRLRVAGNVEGSASTLTVYYSDDDYANVATWGTIDLSSQAAMENGLTRGGSSKRRALKLVHSANTPMGLEALELDYEVASA